MNLKEGTTFKEGDYIQVIESDSIFSGVTGFVIRCWFTSRNVEVVRFEIGELDSRNDWYLVENENLDITLSTKCVRLYSSSIYDHSGLQKWLTL